jgi:hypothetical protein
MYRAAMLAIGPATCRKTNLRFQKRRTSAGDPKSKQQMCKGATHEQEDSTTSQRRVTFTVARIRRTAVATRQREPALASDYN